MIGLEKGCAYRMKEFKKKKKNLVELTARTSFERQNWSGFKSKLDSFMGGETLNKWLWVHPMIVDIKILGICKFAVAGVEENSWHCSHLPSSYAHSSGI